MKVEAESFLACESMRLEGDLYFLLAGGMSTIRVVAFPALSSFCVASRIVVKDIGTEASIQFNVAVLTSDGDDLLAGSFNPVLLLARDSDSGSVAERFNLPLNFRSIVFPKPGPVTISMRWNSVEVASTGFDVRT